MDDRSTSGPNAVVTVGSTRFGNALPMALIAGPCALESRQHALEMASALKEITGRLGLGFVYKTSFDKANRTSGTSARGIGLDAALPIFAEIRASLGVPVLTDVHEAVSARASPRRSTCCRSRPSCAGRPTSWSRRPRPGAPST
jgi:2-dehydro-3-deoxyphosphooctonate aldolase (KDO 8-P synthase)